MNNKRPFFKRLGFFLIILGLPALFLFILSKGVPHYKRLAYFGPAQVIDKDTNYYRITNFTFNDGKGNRLTQDDFEGKTIIANIIFNTCPTKCSILFKLFQDRVYKEILKEKNTVTLLLLPKLLVKVPT